MEDVWRGFKCISRETRKEIPVRVKDEKREYSGETIDAVIIPYDLPEGNLLSVCKSGRSGLVPQEEPPGLIMYSEGSYSTWYSPHPLWAWRNREEGVVHAVPDDGFALNLTGRPQYR